MPKWMPTEAELTPDVLRRLFDYDAETGVLTRKAVSNRKDRIGKEAGTPQNTGYRSVNVGCRRFLAHRLIWAWVTGGWPSVQIDHVNGRRSDNRFANLREATVSENGANRGKPRNNTSGVKGVWWDARRQRWVAEITCKGRVAFFGRFKDINDAERAHKAAAANIFGQFSHAGERPAMETYS